MQMQLQVRSGEGDPFLRELGRGGRQAGMRQGTGFVSKGKPSPAERQRQKLSTEQS